MIAPASIAEILGLGASIRTVGDLESAVSAGLPKRSLERLSTRLYAAPSVITEGRESNLLFNPQHQEFAPIQANLPEAIHWDLRLF